MSFWSWITAMFTRSTPPPFVPFAGRITAYGYPGDSTPDSNSAEAIGAWNNTLVDCYSLAVSRDVEAAFHEAGIHPLDAVQVCLKTGDILTLCWADRTAASYGGQPLTGRFDLYCAKKPSVLVDSAVVGFRKAQA